MKFLDKIAINALVKTITDFILAILKMFNPTKISDSPKKRSNRDLLDRWIKK